MLTTNTSGQRILIYIFLGDCSEWNFDANLSKYLTRSYSILPLVFLFDDVDRLSIPNQFTGNVFIGVFSNGVRRRSSEEMSIIVLDKHFNVLMKKTQN